MRRFRSPCPSSSRRCWSWSRQGQQRPTFSGHSAVDDGEIRYEDDTQWNDALNNAISGWENLPGGVSIAADSATAIADLEVGDYTDNGDSRCGYYSNRVGADRIRVNGRYFPGYSQTNRRACMLHEWGHAHGLAHSYDDQAMDDCPVSTCAGGTAYVVPQSHDRPDYDHLW